MRKQPRNLAMKPCFFQNFYTSVLKNICKLLPSLSIFKQQKYSILFICFIFYIIFQHLIMTQYWTSNACSMGRNTAFGNFSLQGFRKGLITELFLVFFVYFITQAMHAFRYKNTIQKPVEVRQSLTQSQKDQQRVDPRPDLPWHQKKWNRTFAIIFSSHCIAIGTCLLFSPFAGAMAIAYIHFGIFIGFVICEFKMMEAPSRLCRILMDLMNLTLILIGVIGINNCTCNKNNYCSVTQSNLGVVACFG